MTDATTTVFGWSYPTVGADAASWGGTINATIQAIDAAVVPRSGATATLSIAPGAHAQALAGGGGALILVSETNTTGATAAYLVGNQTVVLLGTTGVWSAPTSTPSASAFSVFYASGGYNIYNGYAAGTFIFSVTSIKIY